MPLATHIINNRVVGLFIIVLLFLLLNNTECHGDVQSITKKIRNNFISENIDDNEINKLLKELNCNGSWNDIDYSDMSVFNWKPVTHTSRLKTICIAYNKLPSSHYSKQEVKESIYKIINFYIEAKPKSDNWYYNAIAAPQNLGSALVLMKTGNELGFNQKELDYYSDRLLNYYSNSSKKWPAATTGANKLWLLKSSIYKAAVKGCGATLSDNFRHVFEEVDIKEGKSEGIKIDKSFWQHGPQLYSAGYGMAFLDDITYFVLLASDTDYRISEKKLALLTDTILDGFMWFIHRSAFDFNTTGREIARPNAGSSLALMTYISRLIEARAPRIDELKSCIEYINGVSEFSSPGTKFFWKSDMMVHHGEKNYLSAKIPSKRTIGTERMNSENLKSKWLPWGSTNIMNDGDEYRNLFPVWDWSRVPGVTSYYDAVNTLPEKDGSYFISNTSFAGGCSNGICGIAAYDYSFGGISAKKAYYFSPGSLYCLGAGITASGHSHVITSINQCYSSGKVIVGDSEGSRELTRSQLECNKVNWIFHNNIGYVFPSGGCVSIFNGEQTGSWYDINRQQSICSVAHQVFGVWLNHEIRPRDSSYEYNVLPSKTEEQVQKWVSEKNIYSIVNNSCIQAVHDKINDVYAIVFYKSGSVPINSGLTIGVDKPCLILLIIHADLSLIELSLSDPTQTQDKIKIFVSRKLLGPSIYKVGHDHAEIDVILPRGDDAGRSIYLSFDWKFRPPDLGR